MSDFSYSPSRRQLFSMIGKLAGAATMYQAMTSLGFAGESDFGGVSKSMLISDIAIINIKER